MPVSIVCPNCQSSLQVADHLAGHAVLCGHCSQPLQVPRPTRPTPIPLPSPPPSGGSAPFPPSAAPPTVMSREPRSGFSHASRRPRSRPSNLLPLLTWVGLIALAAAVVVAVFVEGNRRRAERRQQEEIAKASAKPSLPQVIPPRPTGMVPPPTVPNIVPPVRPPVP